MLTFLAALAVCTACAVPTVAGALAGSRAPAMRRRRANPWPAAPAVSGPVLYDRERAVMA